MTIRLNRTKRQTTRPNGALTKGLLAATVAGAALLGLTGQATAQPENNVRFTVIAAGGGPGTVLAWGAIRGVGTETDNQTPGNPAFQATLSFAHGQVNENVWDTGPPNVQFNPTTCTLRIVDSQGFQITGGTGAFATATGRGTSTAHVTIIENRGADGTCDQHAPPALQLVIARETGTVAFAASHPA